MADIYNANLTSFFYYYYFLFSFLIVLLKIKGLIQSCSAISQILSEFNKV